MSERNTFNIASGSSARANRLHFFEAAKHNHAGVLKEYLKTYADAAQWRQADGKTALEVAVEQGHDMAVQELIIAGAKTVETREFLHHQPLNLAAMNGRLEIAALLLHHGAAVEGTRGEGRTPLLDAVYYNRTAVMELLLKRGASMAKMTAEGQAALHLAAMREWPDAVTLLLDHGADIDARNKRGLTPLMLAADNGSLGAAAELLKRGCNHALAGPDGRTARAIAQAHGDNDPAFVEAFEELLRARWRRDGASAGKAFMQGSEKPVTLQKPLQLRLKTASNAGKKGQRRAL